YDHGCRRHFSNRQGLCRRPHIRTDRHVGHGTFIPSVKTVGYVASESGWTGIVFNRRKQMASKGPTRWGGPFACSHLESSHALSGSTASIIPLPFSILQLRFGPKERILPHALI